MTRAIVSASLLAATITAFGQETAKHEFEAASIKPFEPVQTSHGSIYKGGPCISPNPLTLSCHGTSLRMLVARA